MKNINLFNEKSGVAGVIEALLLVALVAVVISTIQLVYIPQVMEQREAEHMDVVSNQFSYLKSMVDIQTVTQSSAPMFSMITLGSRELPYFVTARGYGEIRIPYEEDWNIKIISNDSGIYNYDLTSLTYEAYNSYYVDQIYSLEGGGVIVKQLNGEPVMRVDPSISVKAGAEVNIDYDLPIIIGFPGKNLTYGFGKCFVRTNWSKGDTDYIKEANNINISTQYPHAWNESLHNLLGDNVNYEKGKSYVKITKKNKDINLNVKYYYIYVQIGPGWIK